MELQVGILTVSDRCSKGEAEDKSGPAIHAFLEANKEKFKFASTVRYTTKTVPDERDIISKQLIEWSDVNGLQLIVTTGGTGFAPRDVTPEATKDVIHKEAPGFVVRSRVQEGKESVSTPFVVVACIG
jgi:gephyrin